MLDEEPNFEKYSYQELIEIEQNINKVKYPARYKKVVELLNNPSRLEKSEIASTAVSEQSKYCTFWPRFWAAFIDGLIFTSVLVIQNFISGVGFFTENEILQAVNSILFTFYFIFMHGYYGQTIGKMAMSVKVLDFQTEKDIDINQALRRESVNLLLNSSWLFLVLLTYSVFGNSDSLSENLSDAASFLVTLGIIWVISEFVTMLFNDKRRALHDFVGNTVVVRI